MEEKKNILSEEELEKVAGGAYLEDDLPPIMCPRCVEKGLRSIATFTHITYMGANEYRCSEPSCGCYIYYDGSQYAIYDERFGPGC